MKCAFVFLIGINAAAGITLRSTDGKVVRAQVKNSMRNVSTDAGQAQIDQAMDAVAAMMKAHAPKKHAVTHTANATAPGHRAKLDVGFTSFEKDINQTVESGIRNATTNEQWTKELQQQLIMNISGTMCQKFREGLKPIKQSIGQTWMALPEDQQDDYVNRMREGFASDWQGGMETLFSHFKIGLRRVGDLTSQQKKLSSENLLANSERTLLDALVNPRCYGGMDDSLLQLTDEAAPTTTAAPKHHKVKRFCMPPSINTLVGRFNDTEGLQSMSFRFEANALSMLQTGVKRRTEVIGHK